MFNQPNHQSGAFQESFQAVTQVAQALVALLDQSAATAGNALVTSFQPLLEPLTEIFGRVIAPIDDWPFIRFATGVPGLKWLLAAVGQVNQAAVRQDVETLRSTYPLETNRQLAQRVITQATANAAKVGLITNLVSSFALLLLVVDLGAVAALQSDMIYRIAAIYGYSPDDSARRGEVLAVWLLFSGGSSAFKSGISGLELIPGIGAVVGVASDASLIYGVGYLACRYYETKTVPPGTTNNLET